MSDAELAHHKQVIADTISNSSDGFVNTFVHKPYVEETQKPFTFNSLGE